ncbi:MAG: glycoside hydrolase family 9 [Leptolyngbya sp. LCM1.Bin17]|nr:MAG: glycoside hydrolase family 9 [Leptolyngbya sp. LCM1.Bin17]
MIVQSRQLRKIVFVSLISMVTFVLAILIGCGQINSAFSYRFPANKDLTILVDQFGYRPNDQKVAVIIQPVNETDSDSNVDLAPMADYLSDSYQVISLGVDAPVYQAKASIWNQGKVHSQSGDRAAWLNFSSIHTPGRYIIRNSRTGETSAEFYISESVYKDILVAATRMFFYQRSGFAKQPPFADERWVDDAAFLGPGQDTEARFVNDKDNPALERDMRGGWFDAGDTNKYVTFAVSAVHKLLDAYVQNSGIWTDDFNIPESGNGIPDILDELQFELDWLQRMQDDDGGVFIKLGTLDFNRAEKPSLDRRPRFYGPKCSSSSIANAGMFAHAALVFRNIPALALDAQVLQDKAVMAWDWFNEHPKQIDCDTQEIKAGDADRSEEEQVGLAVSAAAYLFALTEDPVYEDYIIEHFEDTRPFEQFGWAIYESHVGDALLAYAELDFGRPEIQEQILQTFAGSVSSLLEDQANLGELDPYRAYIPDEQYHWGSNNVKANFGNEFYNLMTYGADNGSNEFYSTSALSMLHYLHGINPFGMVYLTNMYDYGVTFSANEMYHEWFGRGIYDNALTSPSGPAPGYLTGGPNRNYTGSAPLAEYPPMKAYLDSNQGGDLRMWEITEPSIAYQSTYIKLLSKFVTDDV